MPTAAEAAPKHTTPTYSWFVLFMLMFIYIFNFLDRQLMATLQEFIKEDLGFSDGQLGMMTGFYFALFYTGFGVIVGFVADRTSRVKILAAGCFIWSLFTTLCGLARTFPVMAAARIGVGVGEAAGAPPSYSIISDYFPAEKRGLALALFSLGVPFGLALGAGLGVRLATLDVHWVMPLIGLDIHNNWRFPFVAIGILGAIASIVLLVVVREPKRGAMDAKPAMATGPGTDEFAHETSPGFIATVKDFFSDPILLWSALGGGMAAFVQYAYLNWNVSFLIRVKDTPTDIIQNYYALMLAIAMGLGTFLSGAIVDFLAKRSKVWYGLMPAIALALCIPFHFLYIATTDPVLAIIILSVPTFLTITFLAPTLAVTQNTVRPSQRTMAGALLLMVFNLIGLGGGPTMMGFVSDYFARGNDPSYGLTVAYYVLTPFFALAVLFLYLMARALGAKEKRDALARAEAGSPPA